MMIVIVHIILEHQVLLYRTHEQFTSVKWHRVHLECKTKQQNQYIYSGTQGTRTAQTESSSEREEEIDSRAKESILLLPCIRIRLNITFVCSLFTLLLLLLFFHLYKFYIRGKKRKYCETEQRLPHHLRLLDSVVCVCLHNKLYCYLTAKLE